MLSRKRLSKAITALSIDLKQLSGAVADGVANIKRTTDHRPCIGPREFRGVLEDMEQDASDFAANTQVLESLTLDAVSFEELLGHALALYHANRNTISQLEAHLLQYGYCPPAGMRLEPEDPISAAVSLLNAGKGLDDKSMAEEGETAHEQETTTGSRMAHSGAHPTAAVQSKREALRSQAAAVQATTPHVKFTPCNAGGQSTGSKYRKTPGMKLGHAPVLSDSDEEDGMGIPPPPGLARTGQGAAPVPGTGRQQAAGASAAAAPATGAKPFRPSIDSHTSCTPEAMVMTPGMMAVLQKYAGSGASTDVSAAGMDSGSAPSQPHLLHGTGAQGKAAQPQPSAGMPNKSAAGHTSSIPRPAIVNIHAFAMAPEDDTCALYHELIRSKDVNCSSLADGSAGSKAGMAQGRGQAAKPAQVSGAAAGIPKLAVNVPAEQQRSGRTSATPLSIRREDWGEHNKFLAKELSTLEVLWVTSGQAALTPGGSERYMSPAPARAAQSMTVSQQQLQQQSLTALGASAAGTSTLNAAKISSPRPTASPLPQQQHKQLPPPPGLTQQQAAVASSSTVIDEVEGTMSVLKQQQQQQQVTRAAITAVLQARPFTSTTAGAKAAAADASPVMSLARRPLTPPGRRQDTSPAPAMQPAASFSRSRATHQAAEVTKSKPKTPTKTPPGLRPASARPVTPSYGSSGKQLAAEGLKRLPSAAWPDAVAAVPVVTPPGKGRSASAAPAHSYYKPRTPEAPPSTSGTAAGQQGFRRSTAAGTAATTASARHTTSTTAGSATGSVQAEDSFSYLSMPAEVSAAAPRPGIPSGLQAPAAAASPFSMPAGSSKLSAGAMALHAAATALAAPLGASSSSGGSGLGAGSSSRAWRAQAAGQALSPDTAELIARTYGGAIPSAGGSLRNPSAGASGAALPATAATKLAAAHAIALPSSPSTDCAAQPSSVTAPADAPAAAAATPPAVCVSRIQRVPVSPSPAASPKPMCTRSRGSESTAPGASTTPQRTLPVAPLAPWASGQAGAAAGAVACGTRSAAGDGASGGGLLRVCSESQHGSLPAHSQRLLPLAELNRSIQALNALLTSRRGGALSAAPSFSMPEVESVSRGASGSKLLLNTLLKLQLCAAAGQGEAGMMYRACM